MRREDIEKAAVNYDSRAVPFRAFIEGAEWRINSVWHTNAEIPNRNLDMYYSGEACLIETNDGKLNFGIVQYGYGYNGKMYYTITCLDRIYTMDEIKRWAYGKDLMPNTEV